MTLGATFFSYQKAIFRFQSNVASYIYCMKYSRLWKRLLILIAKPWLSQVKEIYIEHGYTHFVMRSVTKVHCTTKLRKEATIYLNPEADARTCTHVRKLQWLTTMLYMEMLHDHKKTMNNCTSVWGTSFYNKLILYFGVNGRSAVAEW